MNTQAIFETLAGTYCCYTDLPLTLLPAETSLSSLTGYSPEELAHTFHNSLLELIDASDRESVMLHFEEQLAQGNDMELEFRLSHKEGHPIWVLNKCRRICGENGREYLYGILVDITKSRHSHKHTYKELEQYHIILSQTENIIFEWNFQKDTMFFSNTWADIFGYSPATEHFSLVVKENPYLHPDDIGQFSEHLQALFQGASYQTMEARFRKADGSYLWCRIRATAIRDADERIIKIVGIIINVDTEKKANRALQQRAERDALTKLLNKDTAHKQAEEYLRASDSVPHCALLIIDMDNFKQVNDQSGHLFGDSVLVQAAKEIAHLFRSHDIVARIGGDEFLVLMKDISDQTLVEKRCQQLIAAFSSILKGAPVHYSLSCSIGVAFSPQHGEAYYELFQHADQALYLAKNRGKSQFAIYETQ